MSRYISTLMQLHIRMYQTQFLTNKALNFKKQKKFLQISVRDLHNVFLNQYLKVNFLVLKMRRVEYVLVILQSEITFQNSQIHVET